MTLCCYLSHYQRQEAFQTATRRYPESFFNTDLYFYDAGVKTCLLFAVIGLSDCSLLGSVAGTCCSSSFRAVTKADDPYLLPASLFFDHLTLSLSACTNRILGGLGG